MDMSAISWGIDSIQCKLSHKPGVAASIVEGESVINATLHSGVFPILPLSIVR